MSGDKFNSDSIDANLARILANQENHHTEFMHKFEDIEKRQIAHEAKDELVQSENNKKLDRLNKFMWTCMGGFGAFEVLHSIFGGGKK